MNKIIKQAFTLIELLVVIAIIGILSGLIVVAMGGMTTKANIARLQVFSNSLRNSLMLNLVAQYTFDDITDYVTATKVLNSTAGNVPDSWSTNEGQAYNGPILSSDCVSGQCLSFNETNLQYVSLPSMNSIINLNNYTLSAWVKTTTANTSAVIGVASKLSTQPIVQFGLVSGFALFQHRDDANVINNINSNPIKINDGVWHFITSVRYSASDHRLFVDGIQRGAATNTIGVATTTQTTIGVLDRATQGSFYTGLVDDVRIFDAAASISQIKEQYYAGLNSLLCVGQIDMKEYGERVNLIANE